ncbi:MAG TPA: hypothetical protein VLW53_05920 [Candidatus Eisenbacteria bacterium]|nr:hypothetical protein [Candidatus Eisenbacteria bacterium]
MRVGAARGRSAIGWIAVAVVLVAVAGVVYLHPSLTPATPTARAGPGASAGDERLQSASFEDADHGAVTVLRGPFGSAAGAVTYLTSDGGRSWRRSASTVTYVGGQRVLERTDGAPGQYRVSEDGGRTWRPLDLPAGTRSAPIAPTFLDAQQAWITVLAAPVTSPNGASVALWRTVDGGATWRRLAGTGIPDARRPVQLVFLDSSRGLLTVEAGDGRHVLLVTDDGGETWRSTLTPTSPLPGSRIVAVWLLLLRDRPVVYLLTMPADGSNSPGVGLQTGSDRRFDAQSYALGSDDAGRTWSPPAAGPRLSTGFVVPPVVDARGRLLLLEGRRLWVSRDGGARWTATVIEAPADLDPEFILAQGGGTLFATASRRRPPPEDRLLDGLLHSTDGGIHWEEVQLPAPARR